MWSDLSAAPLLLSHYAALTLQQLVTHANLCTAFKPAVWDEPNHRNQYVDRKACEWLDERHHHSKSVQEGLQLALTVLAQRQLQGFVVGSQAVSQYQISDTAHAQDEAVTGQRNRRQLVLPYPGRYERDQR